VGNKPPYSPPTLFAMVRVSYAVQEPSSKYITVPKRKEVICTDYEGTKEGGDQLQYSSRRKFLQLEIVKVEYDTKMLSSM